MNKLGAISILIFLWCCVTKQDQRNSYDRCSRFDCNQILRKGWTVDTLIYKPLSKKEHENLIRSFSTLGRYRSDYQTFYYYCSNISKSGGTAILQMVHNQSEFNIYFVNEALKSSPILLAAISKSPDDLFILESQITADDRIDFFQIYTTSEAPITYKDSVHYFRTFDGVSVGPKKVIDSVRTRL